MRWNEQLLVREAAVRVLATADNVPMREGIAILTGHLRSYAPSGVTWTWEPDEPEKRHDRIVAQHSYDVRTATWP